MFVSKVFAILWVWHCILILAGVNRIVTRSVQLLSHRVRYFLMKMMMHRSVDNYDDFDDDYYDDNYDDYYDDNFDDYNDDYNDDYFTITTITIMTM